MKPKHQLIVSILPRGAGEPLAAAANAAGARGGTILLARGTATHPLLRILGFGDTPRDVLLTAVENGIADAVANAIRARPLPRSHGGGILMRIPRLGFARSGDVPPPHPDPSAMPDTPAQSQVLLVIVNRDYADEAMAAARKAGAGGGTVLTARGTARPDDAAFLGVPLVPEKEILLIHADGTIAEAVFHAICSLPCFREKGSGVAFRLPVSGFARLGE